MNDESFASRIDAPRAISSIYWYDFASHDDDDATLMKYYKFRYDAEFRHDASRDGHYIRQQLRLISFADAAMLICHAAAHYNTNTAHDTITLLQRRCPLESAARDLRRRY